MKTLVFLLMLSQSSVFGAERPESGNCTDELMRNSKSERLR